MNDIYSIIFGALLAIGGGAVSNEIQAWRDRCRERRSIIIAIGDELSEIESTIGNMHEVWKQAKVLSPSYITDLLGNTTAFDSLRTRLFLIKDNSTRKRIVAFYKKIKDTGEKSKGRLGTLADSEEARAEQATFDSEFQGLCNEASNIRKDLE